ncbi:MAG: family 16 glycoside hydrolase, partial [Pirellulales bacterium]
YYQSSPTNDPLPPENGTQIRALRGGNWFNGFNFLCRSADRQGFTATVRHPQLGFRVVRVSASVVGNDKTRESAMPANSSPATQLPTTLENGTETQSAEGGESPQTSRAATAKPIDLLKQLNLRQPGTVGDWQLKRSQLIFPQFPNQSVAIYDGTPDDYKLTADIRCNSHTTGILFGIVVGNAQATVAIDGWGKSSSGLGLINGLEYKDTATSRPGCFLEDGAANHVEITVHKNSVEVRCNGEKLFNWTGDPSQLSVPPKWAGRHSPRQLFVGMGGPSPFAVTELTLTDLAPVEAASVADEKLNSRAAQADAGEDGWVPLFNGKDLTGWKTIVDKRGAWRVENGVIIGSSNTKTEEGVLRTERENFTDFHLRVEARINGGGYGGVNFRIGHSPDTSGRPRERSGYHAVINSTNANPNKTGGLGIPGRGPQVSVTTPAAPHDRWFVLEAIVIGHHILIKVDGRTTADYVDPFQSSDRGGVALLATGGPAVVEFRKIEIKEVPQP